MDIKLAPDDPQSMSQDGDSILRSLQNNSLPMMDLMVRESLQNSLDATLRESDETVVEFKVGEFSSEKLAPHFTNITEVLESRYVGEQEFISIRDKNTSGLTGDFKAKNASELNKSNFQKLIFGIGKNQEAEGAGGSWGLGKTSYFRLGAGLVIYYTRIKTDIGYEDRLIASLIESPKYKERLLPSSDRGIAWWGARNSEDNSIYPLTDKNEISKILTIFGLELYGEETGTTIIIPYLNPTMKDPVLPGVDNKETLIKMAVKRWYAPRLENEDYSKCTGNSYLKCLVNQDIILPKFNTEPIFDKIRELYTVALTQEKKPGIELKPIYLKRNAMDNPSEVPTGWLAFQEVTREMMLMTPPDNKPSALAYLGVDDEVKFANNYSQIIGYARKPGMIVEYNIDSDWAPSKPVHKEDTLLIGFFVPNSKGLLIEKYREDGFYNLESYLRATENADHALWLDKDGYGIVKRIKSYITKAIGESYQEDTVGNQTSATSALSRKFGKQFLPPKNFGKTSRTIRGKDSVTGEKTIKRSKLSDIKVLSTTFVEKKRISVNFSSYFKGKSTSKIFLQLLTQESKLDKSSWEKSMGDTLDFPFSIIDLRIESINNNCINESILSSYDVDVEVNHDYCKIVTGSAKELEVLGHIVIEMDSAQFIPTLAIHTEK